MTDTNNSGEKSLGPAKPTLHLKRPVDGGTVRQSFSHGRSKVVVVEKKRRVVGPGEGAAPAGGGTISLAPKAAAPAPKPPRPGGPRPAAPGRAARADAWRRAARPPRRRRAPASCCRR